MVTHIAYFRVTIVLCEASIIVGQNADRSICNCTYTLRPIVTAIAHISFHDEDPACILDMIVRYQREIWY